MYLPAHTHTLKEEQQLQGTFFWDCFSICFRNRVNGTSQALGNAKKSIWNLNQNRFSGVSVFILIPRNWQPSMDGIITSSFKSTLQWFRLNFTKQRWLTNLTVFVSTWISYDGHKLVESSTVFTLTATLDLVNESTFSFLPHFSLFVLYSFSLILVDTHLTFTSSRNSPNQQFPAHQGAAKVLQVGLKLFPK